MKHLYAVAYTAVRQSGRQMSAGYLVADSDRAAQSEAELRVFTAFPERDGFYQHRSTVTRVVTTDSVSFSMEDGG